MKPIWRYECKLCKAVYLLSFTDRDVGLLKPSMNCPCGKGKLRRTAVEIGKGDGTLMAAVVFYQACSGQGLPKERQCSPQQVKKLLTGMMIEKVELAASPDPKRAMVLSIKLESGKTLHFGSSNLGATVYKVTEE